MSKFFQPMVSDFSVMWRPNRLILSSIDSQQQELVVYFWIYYKCLSWRRSFFWRSSVFSLMVAVWRLWSHQKKIKKTTTSFCCKLSPELEIKSFGRHMTEKSLIIALAYFCTWNINITWLRYQITKRITPA